MTYLSVCSGIEAATVAWRVLEGWRPVAFAEVAAFPRALLRVHYPQVPNWGDLTQWEAWPDATVDVLVGGTPCQSFSIAGLRAGLADPRGALLFAFLAVARRYRPRWLVWENVPGVLSIDDGRAFGTLLGGLGVLGYGFAYRILDAQYFGVAQRRRRVFVVGHLGDWRRAAAVLVERASLSGHPAPRRDTGEGTGPGAQLCAAGDLAFCLNAGAAHRIDAESETLIAVPAVAEPVLANAHNTYTHSGNNTGLGNVVPVAFQESQSGFRETDLHPTLDANNGSRRQHGVQVAQRVRRLTPRECERLQGFPDDYTAITFRGRPAKDAPRYRAIGNSMAVPVMRWIGERIHQVERISPCG